MPEKGLAAVARRLAGIIGHGAQGVALARRLARADVRTRRDLKRPAVFARLPRESQSRVMYNPQRNVPLAVADAIAAEVLRRLVVRLPGGRPRRLEVMAVGSVRRRVPRVKDIDFLIIVPRPLVSRVDDVLAAASLRPPRRGDRLDFADTYASGVRRRSFMIRRREAATGRDRCYRSDFFVCTEGERPYALFHYTGPAAYNIRTRAHAKSRGLLLNQYGLFDARTRQRVRGSTAVHTEKELAEFLGVTYRTPTDR